MSILRGIVLLALCAGVALAGYPAPPEYPTKVYVTASINSISRLDAVDSSFQMDFYLVFAWRDDRLSSMIGQELDPNTQFHPSPEIINVASGDTDTSITLIDLIVSHDDLPEWVNVPSSGNANETWVVSIGRKIGGLAADLELKEFPFDRQNATVNIESAKYVSSDLTWVISPQVRESLRDATVGGWDNGIARAYVTNFTYAALEESYARLTFAKLLRRQYAYYMSRVFSNIIMLVIMAFFVVFIRATEPDRLGFVQSAFLGVVSWLFVLNAEVPKVGYLTRLDAFTQVSFAVIFAQYIYHAVHWGFFKTYDRKLGRLTDDDDYGEVPVGPGPAKEPNSFAVQNPLNSNGAAAVRSGAGPEAEIEAAAVGAGAAAGESALMRVCCHCPLPCSINGNWKHFNPHRQLDFAFTMVLAITYAIAVAGVVGEGIVNLNDDQG